MDTNRSTVIGCSSGKATRQQNMQFPSKAVGVSSDVHFDSIYLEIYRWENIFRLWWIVWKVVEYLESVYQNIWPFFQQHKIIWKIAHWCWTSRFGFESLFLIKDFLLGWEREYVRVIHVLQIISLWILLCVLMYSHVGTGRCIVKLFQKHSFVLNMSV